MRIAKLRASSLNLVFAYHTSEGASLARERFEPETAKTQQGL